VAGHAVPTVLEEVHRAARPRSVLGQHELTELGEREARGAADPQRQRRVDPRAPTERETEHEEGASEPTDRCAAAERDGEPRDRLIGCRRRHPRLDALLLDVGDGDDDRARDQQRPAVTLHACELRTDARASSGSSTQART
jgi:hypothetical protein